jgi:hypothetical protein
LLLILANINEFQLSFTKGVAMPNVFQLTNIDSAPSAIVQDLGCGELSAIVGGANPPQLTQQQQVNAYGTVIAGTIGAVLGGNALGAPALGYGAGATYVFGILIGNAK